MNTVAVIGAGPSGLAVCKTLAENSIDYACFEASDTIGGVWNVERAGSGGYRSLRTNTSTAKMAYPDFPFEPETPTFPDAARMLRYFHRYADHHRLWDSIAFNSPVRHARPLDGGGWELELGGGDAEKFTSVVVASGQYVKPRLKRATTPGNFTGEQLHVSDYLDAQTPVDLRGKRVVVVGLGSSAAELAAELCDPAAAAGCAEQVVLSARSGRWVMPKSIDGVPLDSRSAHPAERPHPILRALPGDLGQALMRRIMSRALRGLSAKVGDADALGLPAPSIEPWQERPTMSMQFIPALRDRRIDVRPAIERFDGTTVHFSDGTWTRADVILYATGYQLDFPYLDRAILGCDAPDLALYQGISHTRHDRLFFVGCCRGLCSIWPLAELQSRWIAGLLCGRFELPSSEERCRQAVTLAQAPPVLCNFYVESLRQEAGGF